MRLLVTRRLSRLIPLLITIGVARGGPAGVVDLRTTLEPIIARAGIPGMAALVLRGDQIIARGRAGVRVKGAPERIGPDDEFQICSCTKAMTATIAAELIEEGKLRWDSPLPEIFGGSMKSIDPGWRAVTIRELLSDRAGIRDHVMRMARALLFRHGTLTDQRREFAARLLTRRPDTPPGTEFCYSNTDYILLGAAEEQVTGRAWEDLVRERIFRPLGMTTGGFGPPGSPGQHNEPWGHGKRRILYFPVFGNGDVPFGPGQRGADYPRMYGPAGTVHLSLSDWAKFVAVVLRSDPANPHRRVSLLKADLWARLLEPEGGESNYVCGWFAGTRSWAKGGRSGDTGRVLYHQGDNGRWTCAVWVAPEIDLAVLVACNRGEMEKACDKAASTLVGRYAKAAAAVARVRTEQRQRRRRLATGRTATRS